MGGRWASAESLDGGYKASDDFVHLCDKPVVVADLKHKVISLLRGNRVVVATRFAGDLQSILNDALIVTYNHSNAFCITAITSVAIDERSGSGSRELWVTIATVSLEKHKSTRVSVAEFSKLATDVA